MDLSDWKSRHHQSATHGRAHAHVHGHGAQEGDARACYQRGLQLAQVPGLRLPARPCVGADGAVLRSVRGHRRAKVEVEVEDMEQVNVALEAGAHIIMLDNMSVSEMAEAMKVIGDKAIVEASGGITYDTVRAVAETGVDLISIGGLTHSVHALDISLDLEFD